MVISLDDVSAVCLALGVLGLAVVQALYITGGYPTPADSALCDVVVYAWEPRVDFSESVDKLVEGAGLGAVGGAMYALGVVGEGETSHVAGDM